jgi:diguanylate cyclase (GGDEF)-like protein
MLSGINTLIVRAHDRDELFSGACRIAVENGGFRMSLIARVNLGALKIVPVASAGNDDALLTSVKDLLSSTEAGAKTIVARAIRDRKAVVSNDLQSDPIVVLGEEYAERSARSMAILPLIVAGEAVGVIALYANESEFFQQDELNLLMELADNIALAIDLMGKQERLEYLAYYDVLTGLANRSLFIDRVAQHIRSAVSGGHQLALFLIDLERFKNINDSLGRPAGDALLKQAAEWLARNAGDASLVARVDADHFAAVLPQLTREGDVPRLLDKMIHAFQEHPFHLEETVFRLAVKVGVAIFPEDGGTADTLFKNAEAALKKAKSSGDRFLFYAQKMTAMVAGKLTLENQLRQALEKNEFVIYYQPKMNLASGGLTSAEALIRWNDPRTGMVAPSGFIPILEETGLIHDVGRWVLRKAVEDYLRWLSAGLAAVRIAVNVSPLQLRHRDFIAEIKEVIGIDARAPAGLELEITESLIMEDVSHSIASLQAIRAMGVSIAIDDFGTGFSSLSYLSKLPVDTLKIDRSFIVDMTSGPEGLALVSTVINLAHSLRLKVVAEGVETEEQSRLLRLLNCDELQGNLYSKPMPGELFETRYLAAAVILDARSNTIGAEVGRESRSH